MFQLIDTDPAPDQVRRITFVPFLADGRCVLIEEPGGPALPAGDVQDGEDYLLDTVLRVPLQTAGLRYQHFHPFGLDQDHLYAWIEGGPYTGSRPHRSATLSFVPAEEAAERLRAHGEPVLAAAVRAAAESYRGWMDRPSTRTTGALWRLLTCAGRHHSRVPGSAATSRTGSRPGGTSPKGSSATGPSWTSAVRTGS